MAAPQESEGRGTGAAEAGGEVETVDSVRCKLCDDGIMMRAVIKPYNVNVGIALGIMGVLCLITGVLALIGLIMLLIGLYFILAKKEVWLCEKCQAMVERM